MEYVESIMDKNQNNLLEKIVSLCKRRGFVFPGSEIYGGLSNSWDYGPLGVELKNNIKQLWWKKFVHERDDMVGIDAALIMNPSVWEASGHLGHFSDYLVDCRNCGYRFRPDQEIPGFIIEQHELKNGVIRYNEELLLNHECKNCGKKGQFTVPIPFNLMLKTFIGPRDFSGWNPENSTLPPLVKETLIREKNKSIVYFRPETAQAMFVDFKNVLDTSRKTLPFGIAQIGKAFRNEITPGNFIFRTREFEQMEIEYFINEKNWKEHFKHWQQEMMKWMVDDLGLKKDHIHEVDIPDGERAHYSKKTIDFEFDYPFGRKELYGLAYRTDFDLKNHFKEPPYRDQETGEMSWPHVIEPSLGVDRSVLAVLLSSYHEEGDRVVLKLKPDLAPYRAAVFPLLRNKPELIKKAELVYKDLKKEFNVVWDDRGNIGKRYFSQDEIGTPYCITVDFQTLEDDTVTIRDRDSMEQKRIKISEIKENIVK